jgi:hypothetical protein
MVQEGIDRRLPAEGHAQAKDFGPNQSGSTESQSLLDLALFLPHTQARASSGLEGLSMAD